MENWQQFEQVLSNFCRPEEEYREQAEAVIQEVSKVPDKFLVLLIQVVGNTQLQAVKESSQEIRDGCKVELLKALDNERIDSVRKKICDGICEIVNLHIAKKGEPWLELPNHLFTFTQSQESCHRQSAYYIFSVLPTIFGEDLSQHLGTIHGLLERAMSENEPDMKVRVYAMRATAAFILIIQKAQERNQFANLTPQMLDLMVKCHTSNQMSSSMEVNANAALQSLVNIAGHVPVFFRPNLHAVFSNLASLADHKDLDVQTRGLAVEVLVTLAEKKPGMIRKMTEFCNVLIPIAFKMMIDINDDMEEWTSAGDNPNDTMEEEVPELGEQILDRLSRYLGGKAILNISFQTIRELLQNQDWRYRHAALKGIAAVGEGAQRQIMPKLADVVNMVLQFLGDPHPRVRFAACHALGQLSTDMNPKFQKDHGTSVLPGLLTCMSDEHPRVQSHAAAALVNFSEHAKKELLKPFLHQIFLKLYEMLNSAHRIVLEQAIMSIAIVADSSQELFTEYYDHFMPALKSIFLRCQTKEESMLRGKTLECMSFIGLAVQANKFKADAIWIMQQLAQDPPPAADDPQVPFLLAAHGRICRTIGTEFVVYLPFVLPPLLATAKLEPELSITDIDSPEASSEADAKDWEYLYMQNYKIGIKSSTLEDKCTACEMLCLYVEILKEGFAPYLEEVAGIMVPLLEFYYHEGVRIAAAECLPHLLVAAMAANQPVAYIQSMWELILEKILAALKAEDDTEMVVEFLFHFKSCIKVMSTNCLSAEHMNTLGEVLLKQFELYFGRLKGRIDERGDIDYDEDVEEDLGTHDVTDELFILYVTDLLSTLFETHTVKALPVFDMLIPTINQMMTMSTAEQPNIHCNPPNRVFCLCLFADLIRFCSSEADGNRAHYYTSNMGILPFMISTVTDNLASVRRAAAFAVGITAQYGGAGYMQFVNESVEPLIHVISIPDAKKEENIYVTENAISAIGKICKYGQNPQVTNQLLGRWLSWLPISEDEDECLFVYEYLCELIESQNPIILGQNNANVPFLANILTVVLQEQYVLGEAALENRCKNILLNFGAEVPAQ